MLHQVQVLILILEKEYKTVQEIQILGIHQVHISLRIIQTISLIQVRKLDRQGILDIRVEVIHPIMDQGITIIDLQDQVMTPIDPLVLDTTKETLLALDQVLDTTKETLLALDQALDITEVTPLALDQVLDITEAVLLALVDLHLAADLLPEVHLREEVEANKIFLKCKKVVARIHMFLQLLFF